MKSIGFAGYDCIDIAVYFARLLRLDGSSVGIVDATKYSSLLRAICVPESLMNSHSYYRDIIVGPQETITHSDFEHLDYIIYYFGYDTNPTLLQACDEVLMVSDMIPSNVEMLNNLAIASQSNINVLFRNAMVLKYDIKYLKSLLNYKIEDTSIFILLYEDVDYRNRCYLCNGDFPSLSHTSESMQDLLLDLMEQFSERDMTRLGRKEIARLIKRA